MLAETMSAAQVLIDRALPFLREVQRLGFETLFQIQEIITNKIFVFRSLPWATNLS